MPARFPRIEQLLGAPLTRLTAEAIGRFIHQHEREDTDLDFKQALYTQDSKGSDELAKDVAAMANAQGGIIVLGVQDRGEVAVAAPGVALSGAEAQRMRQVIASRVRPLIPGLDILQIPGHPQQASHGFFVLAVPRSPLIPHFVVSGTSKEPVFRCPRRFGADTLWLGEAEIAGLYRSRFEIARSQLERLDDVHREGLVRLDRDGRVWLAVSLAPDVPGTTLLDRAGLETVRQWGKTVAPQLLNSPFFASMPLNHYGVGLRRILVGTEPVTARAKARWAHAELHLDGAGYAASLVAQVRPNNQTRILDDELAAELLAMVDFLCRYAATITGVTGDGMVQVELIPSDGPCSMWLCERTEQAERLLPDTIELSSLPPVRRTIPVDAVATDPAELLRACRLLLGDVVSGFGLVEPRQLTADGRLHVASFGPWRRDSARAWCTLHNQPDGSAA